MKGHLFFFIAVVLVVTSCNGYEKIRKSTDYQLKYTKAFAYYQKGDYAKAGQLYDDIVAVYRGTNRSDTVAYYQAMSYYKQKDYYTASHYFGTHYKNAPQSPFAEEAEFLTGYCYYLQSARPELDQASTNSAIESFQMFLMRHPSSQYNGQCQELLGEMRDKLVDKSYITAKLYYDLRQYKASIVALNNSLNDYPETKHREELMFLLLKSSYLLAENSILDKKMERYQSTLDEYYSFIAEFPKSNFAKEAKQMYEQTDRYLKVRAIDNEEE